MNEIATSFLTALDELNTLTTVSYYQASGDSAGRVNRIADDILSFLIKAYKQGLESSATMLRYELEVNTDDMYDAIYMVIDGKTFYDRVATHVLNDDLTALQTLVESEYHRVYNAAVYDGAEDFIAEGNFGVKKTWYTMLDDKVRDTHRYLENQSVALESEFYTFDGDHAPYPGGFTRPENNVNCRCILQLSTDE